MKKYRIRRNSIADYAIRAAKPLGCLAVAALILAAYSLACADDYEMHKRMEASYQQVSEPLETLESEPIEKKTSEPEQVSQVVSSEKEATIKQANWVSLGNFEITAYCPCANCCGMWADGITADGTIAKEGITVAADTDVLPFGTKVKIDGKIYTVQDTGGAIQGNRIDIFMSDHQTALDWGRQTIEVFVER